MPHRLRRLTARVTAPSSIRSKLLLSVIPAVAIAVSVMTVIAVSKMTAAQRQSTSASIANANRTQAAIFSGQAKARMDIADTLASVGDVLVGGSRSTVMTIEKRVLDRNPDVAGIYIDYLPNAFDGRDADFRGAPGSSATGIFGSYWNRLGGKENLIYAMQGYQSLAWWTQPERTNADSYIEPYLWEGTLLASTTTPIRHDGRFVGVAGVDMLLGSLDAHVRAIRVLRTGYGFAFSHTGILVSYPKSRLVGRETLGQLAAGTHTPAFDRILAAVQAGRSGSVQTRDPLTGKQVEMFYTPVGAGGWGLVSVAPVSEILASAHSLRTTLIVVAILVVLGLSGILVLVASRLAKPAREVSRAARQLSTGDLDVAVRNRSRDEIGQVAASFREMIDYLSGMAAVADEIAVGRLGVEVSSRSERDRLGRALGRMREQIQGLIRQIAAASGIGPRAGHEVGADRRDRDHDHQHRRADQSAGAQRRDRGCPRGRAGPRLRGRGRRGAQAGRGGA